MSPLNHPDNSMSRQAISVEVEHMAEDYKTKSFWLANSGDYRESLSLAGDLKCDVVIVGGGFCGIATAYFLKKAEPSLSVAVTCPPKMSPVLMLDWILRKGGYFIGQKTIQTRANHQQAP
jgi:NADPH-dependent 2,4-dienoyl-CoA reductase/sulfur reductase-like enzyme